MKQYTIRKKCHYSNFIPSIKLIRGRDIYNSDFFISFDESCKYEIEEKSCVNKLFGYSFGIFSIHKNSCRFGWTYNKEIDKIEIWIYCYKNGKLNKGKVGTCDFNKNYFFSIKTFFPEKKTEFNFNNENIKIVDVEIDCCLLLTLGFYFGGNTRAPHKMKINVI